MRTPCVRFRVGKQHGSWATMMGLSFQSCCLVFFFFFCHFALDFVILPFWALVRCIFDSCFFSSFISVDGLTTA